MTKENYDLAEKYYRKEENQDCMYLTDKSKWMLMHNDHTALLDIIDKFKVKTILEVGTWQGFTAGLMLMKDVKIKAIDIHSGMNVEYKHVSHDKKEKENYGKYAIDNPDYEIEFHDTRTYEAKGEFDMVFVDANHEYDFVKSDTELARKFNPKVLVWHDYGSEPGVNKYIDELKKGGSKIIGFEQSLIVYEWIK